MEEEKSNCKEEKILTPKRRSILSLILFLIIIGLVIYLLVYINTESYKCILNSAGYTIKNIEKANSANVTCSCFMQGGNNIVQFNLDNQGITLNNAKALDNLVP